MPDTQPGSAATNGLTVSIDKIGHMVPAVVRNGVILCPECGDEMVEVSRDADVVNYECGTGKRLWDVVYRDLSADFHAAQESSR